VTDPATAAPIRLGLRENLGQFALIVGVNALVGGMIGQERTVLPLLADRVFGLTAYTAALTFIGAVALSWIGPRGTEVPSWFPFRSSGQVR
jgi:hypothetical protein